MEVWKDIEGFEGLYQISNYGRVRSVDRYIIHKGKTSTWKQFKKGKIINPVLDDKGYYIVRLKKDKKYHKKVHRLVAEHFLPRVEGKDYVNHKDGNKLNNHVDNLEWCTFLENIQHAYSMGLNTSNKPRRVQMLDLDGNVIREFYSLHEAAREVGAEPTNIAKVCRGKRKTHMGYRWRYV
jgi:hypothetical protein